MYCYQFFLHNISKYQNTTTQNLNSLIFDKILYKNDTKLFYLFTQPHSNPIKKKTPQKNLRRFQEKLTTKRFLNFALINGVGTYKKSFR